MSRGLVRSWVGETATSLVLTGLGLAFAAGALRMGMFDDGVPGPGMVPAALGVALAALGMAIAARAVIRHSNALVLVVDRDVLAAIFMLFVAILSFEHVGYIVSTFWFLMAGFVLVGRERWLPAAVVAAVATLVTWALFVKALGVGLPAGILAWR